MTKKKSQTRARHPEEKVARREQILEVSFALFQKMSLDDISMDLIAKKSDLAKGTLYLYFKTKEEVFLALLRQELSRWISQIKASLTPVPQPLSAQAFAQVFVASLDSLPELPRLLSLVHSILENNISEQSALEFKLDLKHQMLEVAKIIAHRTPALTAQTALAFLLKSHAILVGIYQMSHPNSMMEKILRNPELQIFQVQFQEQLNETLCLILVGMEEIEKQKSNAFHLFGNY